MKIGKDVIDRIKRGDEEAFVLFYREFFPKIYKYAYRRVKTKEIAEDLTQDTFLKIFKGLKNFELREELTIDMWIYAIERNVIRDWFRKNLGFEMLPLEEGFESKLFPLLSDPYSTAESEYVKEILKISLNEIPTQYRAIIEMRFYMHMSIKDISLKLNKTEGAIKVLQFRAVKALRDKIKENLKSE